MTGDCVATGAGDGANATGAGAVALGPDSSESGDSARLNSMDSPAAGGGVLDTAGVGGAASTAWSGDWLKAVGEKVEACRGDPP